MLNRIFPKTIDNIFPGHWLSLVLFVAVVLMKGLQGFNSVILTRTVATTADGLAIDSFGPAAAQTVLSMFALLGFTLFLMSLLCLVVALRYRAMIPFMYVVLLAMQLGSRLVLLLEPAPRTTTLPPGLLINLGIIAATVIGFALSFAGPSRGRAGLAAR